MTKIRFKIFTRWAILAVFVLSLSCSEEEAIPIDDSTNEPIDLVNEDCGLSSVFRDNIASSFVTTLSHKHGYGSDTVYYYNYSDSSLINYTLFDYDEAERVIERKVYTSDDILDRVETIEYWANGNQKLLRSEQKILETLYQKTNTVQETNFDEYGNITEYKNLNLANRPMNHLIYENFYVGDKIERSVRDDKIYTFDGSTEYSYNAKGLKSVVLEKNVNGEVTRKTELFYNDDDGLVETKTYNSTSLISAAKYTLNDKGNVTKSQNLDGLGVTLFEHHYSYACKN